MTHAKGQHRQTNFFYSIVKEKLPNGQVVPIEPRTVGPYTLNKLRSLECMNSETVQTKSPVTAITSIASQSCASSPSLSKKRSECTWVSCSFDWAGWCAPRQ